MGYSERVEFTHGQSLLGRGHRLQQLIGLAVDVGRPRSGLQRRCLTLRRHKHRAYKSARRFTFSRHLRDANELFKARLSTASGDFSEELLCMGADLRALPSSNETRYLIPVFAVDFQGLTKPLMFLIGPPAILLACRGDLV